MANDRKHSVRDEKHQTPMPAPTGPSLVRPARERGTTVKHTASPQLMPRRGRFVPGQSGNAAGRPQGAQNKTTREAQAIALSIVQDERYLTALRKRAFAGELEPHLQILLWHYAFGKPKDAPALEPAPCNTTQVSNFVAINSQSLSPEELEVMLKLAKRRGDPARPPVTEEIRS